MQNSLNDDRYVLTLDSPRPLLGLIVVVAAAANLIVPSFFLQPRSNTPSFVVGLILFAGLVAQPALLAIWAVFGRTRTSVLQRVTRFREPSQTMAKLIFRVLAVSVAGILVASFATAADPVNPSASFRFEAINDSSLGLWEGDKPVLVYNHGLVSRPDVPSARPRACYFHPVYGLDGELLTDDFPKDHVYHRGMYWAWPHVKIGNEEFDLWSARGELRQVFGRWLAREVGVGNAKLGIENGWFAGDKQLVREQIWLAVQSETSTGRTVDVESTWTPLHEPLTLWGAEGKSYGGFNFRFAPRTKTVITVPENSVLADGSVAPAGKVSDDLVVTKLAWADFVGNFQGAEKWSGAAIFVHPQHRDFPPTWMTRHYGLVSVGWPGVMPQTFPVGEPITCRYRLWIHRGSPTAAEIQTEYDRYRN